MRVSHTKLSRTFNINILDEILKIGMAFALSHFDLFIFSIVTFNGNLPSLSMLTGVPGILTDVSFSGGDAMKLK